jgi:hypothetical protein
VLLSGLGDEPCGLPPALLQAAAYYPPTVGLPAFPAICLLIVCTEISSLLFPPSLVHFQQSHPLCYFSVCCLLFSFFFVGGVSLPRGLCWFIPGVAGGNPVMLGAHLFGLPNVSQAGLELAAGGTAALLFSQCNVVWRRLP